VVLVAGLVGVVIAGVIVGAVARAVGREAGAQRAADLAAVAAGNVMHESYGRLFEPALVEGQPNPAHLEKDAYLALGRDRAVAVARVNGFSDVRVTFPDGATIAPVRVRVVVGEDIHVGGRSTRVSADAEAELGPADLTGFADGGGYTGALAYRQGKPMRPDVALAFDRMEAAARADGISLSITSAYRSDGEQAALWARHPDPKWVARPGTSLHRYATELDLGPPSAYAWLESNSERFHFIRRYSWEPWHFGYALNQQSRPAKQHEAEGDAAAPRKGGGGAPGDGAAGFARGSVPGFVPARFAPTLTRAAQRWNVSATLLAAQIYAESSFNPFARSRAGALGIAQFMPGTAKAMGLDDPFDAGQAIDAQAHLMRDLLRRFGSVPLALAAYNAGPGAVAACGCIPDIPETRGYVARILGLMNGAGAPLVAGNSLAVRLVR
jgi:Transglycosylase SLT domain/D-alanyl-D-alanine carboxypeptidase